MRTIINTVFLLILWTVSLSVWTLETGCGTTPETKITQGAQIVITSVNDAMSEWVAYVNAGKATQKQIDTVKTAYNGYYTAMKTLQAVCDKVAAKDPTATAADLTAANTAVTNAENALIAEVANILNVVFKKV
jgi:hypothetical protein